MLTVEAILEAIKELSPEKRDEVRRQLAFLWQLNPQESATDVDQINNPYGTLLNDIKSPSLRMKRARPRRPPSHIKGKPVCETIVEDRR